MKGCLSTAREQPSDKWHYGAGSSELAGQVRKKMA